MARALQSAVGAGVLAVGAFLAWGATDIRGDAGYGGVGPNFLPWVVACALALCGLGLIREAMTGGYREMEEPSGAADAHWPGYVWVSAGLLANAALITTLGFIISCALCFTLAVRGFHSAEGRLDMRPRAWLRDLLIGAAIAAPVFWMFTQALSINLPGLTETGWL